MDENITVYLSMETDEVVGVQVNNLIKYKSIKEIKYNGGQKCDMETGLCSCGSCH